MLFHKIILHFIKFYYRISLILFLNIQFFEIMEIKVDYNNANNEIIPN